MTGPPPFRALPFQASTDQQDRAPRPGQRVAVPWLGYACGTCQFCLTGWETLCLSQQNTGYSVDGRYAEYFLAEAAFATP